MARPLSPVVGVAFCAAAFVCVTFASLTGVVTAARAQSYDWTGVYAGLNVGGGWYHLNTAVSAACPATGYFCTATKGGANASAIGSLATVSTLGSSFTGGGQVGYSYQFKYLVLGVEGDADYIFLHGSKQFSGSYPVTTALGLPAATKFNIVNSIDADDVGMLRGHLGWAGIPGVLLFIDGGMAVTNLKGTSSFADTAGGSEYTATGRTTLGWTAGAGVQVPLTRNWNVRAEYFALEFPSVSINGAVANPKFPGTANGLASTEGLSAQVFRLGVNYRF